MKNYDALISTALHTLGQLAYDEAKRVCPVRTGRLKRSINIHDRHDHARNTDTVVIGTNVPYAANVEFGGYHRRPKPFLGTGAEAARRSAAAVFTMILGGDSND